MELRKKMQRAENRKLFDAFLDKDKKRKLHGRESEEYAKAKKVLAEVCAEMKHQENLKVLDEFVKQHGGAGSK